MKVGNFGAFNFALFNIIEERISFETRSERVKHDNKVGVGPGRGAVDVLYPGGKS